TQENADTLRKRGVHVVNPDEGYLACGMTGAGRLAGQDAIVAAVRDVLRVRLDFAGQTILVTAGPTQEDVDPVRFLSNRSSGKMGYSVAEAAAQRGAKVILVSGPTSLETPEGVARIDVRTAKEMLQRVEEKFADTTAAIFAAAVADYRAADPSAEKIKRTSDTITLRLEPNPDILATMGRKKEHRLMVGFAAETEKVAEN